MQAVLVLLVVLASVLVTTSSQAVYYVSQSHGNDSRNNCTICAPCKTLSRVGELATENIVHIMLMPGGYTLWNTTTRTSFAHLTVQGLEFPSCLNLTTKPDYERAVIFGDMHYSNISISSLSLEELEWKSLTDHKVSIICSTLERLTLRGVQFNDSFSVASESFMELNIPLELMIHKSVFLKNFSASRRIQTAQILNSTFASGKVQLFNLDYPAAIVNITHSRFLDGVRLFLQKSNATIRWSQFNREKAATTAEESALQVSLPDSLIDARGNFWDHSSGPYSCCNPSSVGRFVVQADTSSWCIDEACSHLTEPIRDGRQYHDGYIASACEYDSYCPIGIDFYLLAAGAVLGLLCLSCLTFALFTYSRYKSAMEFEHSTASFSQSGFKTIALQDPEGHRNKVIHFINVASIFAAALLIILSLFPTLAFLPQRETAVTSTIRKWTWLFAMLVSANRIVRILCCIWTSVVVAAGQPTYRTLLANVIVSSLTLQFAIAFRFSDIVADPMNIITFFDHKAPSFFGISLGLLINFTKFAWVLTSLVILSDLLLAVPLIILTLRIIKKRDFAEVDTIRQQLEQNPIAGEIKSTPTQRSARIISWISLGSSIILGIFAAVVFVFLLLFALLLNGLGAATASNQQALLLFVFQRAAFLAICVVVSFIGFILFRWRFFESAWVTTYLALAFGLSVNIIQVSAYYSFAGSNLQSYSLIILAAGGGAGCLLLILLPTLLAFRLLMRMKTKLAPEFTTSIYEQLEDQLT